MNRPFNEQDEFLLSRLLDDDLPPDEADALRARIAREPELRKAYEATCRVDSLLLARRADQPQIDWSRFHRQVMSQVHAESAGRRTIRLADFLRVALPLAAAAAIILTIWFWPHGGPMAVPAGAGPSQRFAVGQKEHVPSPQVPDSPEIVIRYVRSNPTGTANEIRVTYVRSEELADNCQKRDKESQSSRLALLTGNIRPTRTISPVVLTEASPF